MYRKSLGPDGLEFLAITSKKVISSIKLIPVTYNRNAYLGPLATGFRSRNFYFPVVSESPTLPCSLPLRRRPRRGSSVGGMAHAVAINPIVLVKLLLPRIVTLVGPTIEGIAMRWIPHPIAARRGRRARGDITGNKRLARGGRGRRRRRSRGLRRRRLLS